MFQVSHSGSDTRVGTGHARSKLVPKEIAVRRPSYLIAASALMLGITGIIAAKAPSERVILHVRGSDTVAYVLRRVSEAYMEKNPGVSVLV